MESVTGDVTSADARGQQSLLSGTGDAAESTLVSADKGVRSPGKRTAAGTKTGEGSKAAGPASMGLVPHQVSLAGNNWDSDDSDKRKQQSEKGSSGSTGVGVLKLSSANSAAGSKEEELWQKLEDIMASKQSQVQQVLEDFGIAADVQPASDQLEEQVWKVVQGEATLQEAADLV